MSTISHGPVERSRRRVWIEARDMWASIAICVMWLVVFADALWGPDFVSSSGSSLTKVPSAIVLAVFAWLGTKAVAKYGFTHDD